MFPRWVPNRESAVRLNGLLANVLPMEFIRQSGACKWDHLFCRHRQCERCSIKPYFIAAAVVLFAQTASAQDAVIPAEPLVPLDQWFHPDDYPPASMRSAEEGDVSALLTIVPQGMVTGCCITHSSGHPLLDRATCALAVPRGRFKPAKDVQRIPVVGSYVISGVRWRINGIGAPSGGPPILEIHSRDPMPAVPITPTISETGVISYSVKVMPDGNFGACTFVPSTGSVERDASACKLLTTRLLKKPTLDSSGRPAQSSISGNLRWRVPHESHASTM